MAEQQLLTMKEQNHGGVKIQGLETGNDKDKTHDDRKLLYGVDETPSVPLLVLFAFQMALANIFFCLSVAVFMGSSICADKQFITSIYTTTTVSAGIATLMQTLIGLRLPVFQGPSFMFLLPYMTAKTNPGWGCVDHTGNVTYSNDNSTHVESPWLDNWRKIQGSLLLASILHIIFGTFGLAGLVMKLIGPLTITVMIILLGLESHSFITDLAEPHWPVAIFSMVVAVVCCSYIHRVLVPIPVWWPKKGWSVNRYPLFQLFPVLISVLLSWLLCYILTVAGAFTDDVNDIEYQARTDISYDLIVNATAFTFPYPGQYGGYGFSLEVFVAFLVGGLGSMLESMGDYVQTANACRVPTPPSHGINRGILMEGLSTLVSGALGAGHATTSYSNVIGIINATKIGSRVVMTLSAVIIILIAVLGHVSAVLVSIPKPALAGCVFLGIALLVSSATANLSKVDLQIERNATVVGVGLLFGTTLPAWINANPAAIKTGISHVDLLLRSLLSLPLLVGGVVACVLDTSLPGARSSNMTSSSGETNHDTKVYETRCLRYIVRQFPVLRWFPVLPNVYKQSREAVADSKRQDDVANTLDQPVLLSCITNVTTKM